jgi:phosphate transport system substrate-binding protein
MIISKLCRSLGRAFYLLPLVAAFGIGCGGCGPGDKVVPPASNGGKPDEGTVSDLSGKINIDGSSTVYPISEAAAEEFSKKYPNVDIKVNFVGTGGGFKRFTKGDLDISDASRPITTEEFDECEKNGIKFIELPIAYDGLTVAVSPKNDWAEQLTVDDLKKIYLEGGAQKWNEINPDWPDLPIVTYGAGVDSGTYDYFREVLGGKKVEMRGDMFKSEDDNVLVNGVSGDKGSIGFFGAAYYFTNKDKLRALKIVNPEGKAIAPAPDVIESGDYAPLSRPLFIYVSEKALERRETQRFVSFYTDNAAELAAKSKYVALPKEVYDRVKANFKDRLFGTHYLTESGEKREGAVATVYERANLRAMK